MSEQRVSYDTGREPDQSWQPGLKLSTQNFGTLYAIEIGDELTHQVLLLTPAELEELRQLNRRKEGMRR